MAFAQGHFWLFPDYEMDISNFRAFFSALTWNIGVQDFSYKKSWLAWQDMPNDTMVAQMLCE